MTVHDNSTNGFFVQWVPTLCKGTHCTSVQKTTDFTCYKVGLYRNGRRGGQWVGHSGLDQMTRIQSKFCAFSLVRVQSQGQVDTLWGKPETIVKTSHCVSDAIHAKQDDFNKILQQPAHTPCH